MAPPNTTMIASEIQCTAETLPFHLNQAICAMDAAIATPVATMIPCHLKARKKRMSGK